jgi:uncharacterized repeat protein (TIGR01451 family)
MKRFINLGAAVLITVLVFNYSSQPTLAGRLVAPPSTLRAAGVVNESSPALREPSRTGADAAARPRRGRGTLPRVEDEARLFIDVDSSAEEVLSGSNITYTVTVTNEGGAASSAFAVVDELPSETVFVSCESTGGGVCGGSGNVRSISFNSLLPEATAVITLVAAVSCPVLDATEISNTAEIHPLTPDPDADETDNETIFVTVRNPPPTITGESVSPSSLWPPNHQMVNVAVNYSVEDNCGPVSLSLSVKSNEPINGTGDGDTAPDWQVVNAHLVRLRSERSGKGEGRVYTITITATDSAGQSTSKTVAVSVPKNQKK